jgi:hypothetical protein
LKSEDKGNKSETVYANSPHGMRRSEMLNRRSFLATMFTGLLVFAAGVPAMAAMRTVRLKVPGCK